MHLIVFPNLIQETNGEFKCFVHGRLYDKDKLAQLQHHKHSTEPNAKNTIKYAYKTLKHKHRITTIKYYCHEMDISFELQQSRYTCQLTMSKEQLFALSQAYEHCRILPLHSKSHDTIYYLLHLSQQGTSIISDVDDTIIETKAMTLLKSLKQLMRGYQVVSHMDTLYSMLSQMGFDFHYVTSSPDFLFSVFYPLIEPGNPNKRFPLGSYHSMENSKDAIKTSDRISHKIHHVVRLMTLFPQRQFVFIGDNGQSDVDVYNRVHQIMGKESHRIKAVYIRNVLNSASSTEQLFRDGLDLKDLFFKRFDIE